MANTHGPLRPHHFDTEFWNVVHYATIAFLGEHSELSPRMVGDLEANVGLWFSELHDFCHTLADAANQDPWPGCYGKALRIVPVEVHIDDAPWASK
jgi:hypothetical protein